MHPGQITFFEYKSSPFGRSLLATSNGDLEEIFLWNIYNRGQPASLENPSADTPDTVLSAGGNYEIENMRWSNIGYQLYVTMKNGKNKDDYLLSIYDIPDGINNTGANMHSAEDNGRVSKIKKTAKNPNSAVQKISLPLNISYFCLNDSNKNIIYGTNNTKKFTIDIRTPKSVSYFLDENKDAPVIDNEDSMVEYNQNNYITFANRLQKTIHIYDVRQVN